MPTLSGIFDIGSQALSAFQAGISVAGDNIANANTDGYSRQRIDLTTKPPLTYADAVYGMGVRVRGVERLRDEALDIRIRDQASVNSFLNQGRDIFTQLQTTLQDSLGIVSADLDSGIVGANQALLRFFDAFGELTLEPESSQTRTLVIEETQSLVSTFRGADTGLKGLVQNLNDRIPFLVEEVNSLTQEIANLNIKIVELEAGGARTANTLRDQRGQMLSRLVEIIPAQTTEQPNGSVNVTLGGMLLVSAGRSTNVVYEQREGDQFGRYDLFMEGTNTQRLNKVIDAGSLGAVLEARDVTVPAIMDDFDELAELLITEVNRIHTTAVGLTGFLSLNANNAAESNTLPLAFAGYEFPISTGSFDIQVMDVDGNLLDTYTISVDPAVDSLDDISQRIDNADGALGGGVIESSVGANGILNISVNGTNQFRFSADSAGFLSAVGLNTFFTGFDAASINVSALLQTSPELIAASVSGAPGDGTAALEIAALRETGVLNNGTTSIMDQYQAIIGGMGIQGRRNEELATNSQALLDALENRQEELAGVSIDEEAVELMRYQRAFQAAARLITVVDGMFETIINI